MKAWVQTDKNGDYYNVNAFVANEGFQILGWETQKYYDIEDITGNDPEEVVVGGIGNVRKRLEQFGVPRPENEIDYPEALQKYLGRKIRATTIEELFRDESSWNVFVKPKDETKKFAGKVVRTYKDFIGLIDPDGPTAIWCSEIVDFRTEWRCFIRYNEILDIRRYKGDWDTHPDLSVIRAAITDYSETAPAAYALDFGIDGEGTMKLVEINDGHSLGTYGMQPVSYAKFLSARWAQLTGTIDYTHF